MKKARVSAAMVRKVMSALGKKGGKARLTQMTEAERQRVASMGALARWRKERKSR